MANNLVYFDTTSNVVQQFSASDVAKISDYILEFMAANGTFTGSITVGTSNPIGTFSDTTLGGYPYPEANSDNVTVYSTTYTLSQVNTATLTAASDPPMYVGLDVTDPNTVILQENKTTLDNLADEIVDRMIADYGVNSYYLGTAAPSDGGVWTNLGSLVDTVDPSNPNNTYYLWKKLNSGSYTSDYKRPLKLSSGNLIQFTDIEIQQIVKKVEERIVATGKGLYSISSSAPGTGTWTAVGSSVDVRRTTQEVDFTGSSFSSSSSSNFDGSAFDGNSFFGPTFVGFYPSTFGAGYSAEYVASFTAFVPYTGTNPNGPGFSATYIGDDPLVNQFIGPNTYTNESVPFSTTYIGDNVNNFNRPVTYTGDNVTPFTNPSYVGPGGTFNRGTYIGPGNFTGFLFYLGPGSFTGPTYIGSTSYFGPVPPAYYGPAPFTGPTYYGPVAADFTGTVIYDGSLVGGTSYQEIYYTTYDAPDVAVGFNDVYFATYTATYSVDFTGPSYTADYTGTRVSSSTTTVSTLYLWKRVA